jgi:hypothetical protein
MDKTTAQRLVRETFKAPFDKKRYRSSTNSATALMNPRRSPQ